MALCDLHIDLFEHVAQRARSPALFWHGDCFKAKLTQDRARQIAGAGICMQLMHVLRAGMGAKWRQKTALMPHDHDHRSVHVERCRDIVPAIFLPS